jgi:hypothetical protein
MVILIISVSSLEMTEASKYGSLIKPPKQSDHGQPVATLGPPMERVNKKVFQLLQHQQPPGTRSGLTETVRSLTCSTTSASMFTQVPMLKVLMLSNMHNIKDSTRNGQSFTARMQ